MIKAEWVYRLIPSNEIPRNTDVMKFKRDYGPTGKCTVKWCRHPNSWWTCGNCGAATCKGHQVFNGYIVIKCYYCNGNWQWRRKLAKILKNQKQKS